MFFNYVQKLAKKAYKRGNHLAKKSRHFVLHGSKKARDIIHKSRGALRTVGRIAKVAAPIIADVASILPGQAGAIGRATSLGISGFNTVSNFLDKSAEKARQTEEFADKPSGQTFKNLFS